METQKRVFQSAYSSILRGAGKVRPETKEFAETHARTKARCSHEHSRVWRKEVDSRPPTSGIFARR